MSKIVSVLGEPKHWEEGKRLANKVGYRFPNARPKNLRELAPTASDNAIDLIKQMLSYDPNKRPTAAQCLEHEFF